MTWGTQLELLHHMQNWLGECKSLEVGATRPALLDLRAQLEELEAQHRVDVDAAVRSFARGSGAPTLSNVERFFFAQRVHFAVLITVALCASDESGDKTVPDPPETWDKDDQVEWLLVHAWRTAGRVYWLEKAILNEIRDRSLQSPS